MQSFMIVVGLLTFVITEMIACYKGLNLKRWSSWLYGVVSFLCGLVLGFSLGSNLTETLKLAGLLAIFTLLGGVVMSRHKQRYEGMVSPLLLKYGEEEDLFFLEN